MNNSQRVQILSTREPGCSPRQWACRVWALSPRGPLCSPRKGKAVTAGRNLRPRVEGRKAKVSLLGQYWLILLLWFKTKQNNQEKLSKRDLVLVSKLSCR